MEDHLTPNIADIIGASEAAQQTDEINEQMAELPEETNRATTRARARMIKALLRNPDRDTRMFQGFQPSKLTKNGAARLRKRRAKAKAAHAARKVQQRQARRVA